MEIEENEKQDYENWSDKEEYIMIKYFSLAITISDS